MDNSNKTLLFLTEERILEVVNWFQTEIRKLPNRKTYFRYPTHTIYCEKNNI